MSVALKNENSQEVEEKLSRLFEELAEKWKKETAFDSTMLRITMHPAYQRIMGMGPAALPFIFRDLAKQPDYWFIALTAITGENPVPKEDAGNLPRMTKAWLEWAERNGYEY